jgi:hypothetical protein
MGFFALWECERAAFKTLALSAVWEVERKIRQRYRRALRRRCERPQTTTYDADAS